MKRVINALSEGFELVLKQPWILLIPILLDLFLWLGPKVSLEPLISQGLEAMNNALAQMDPAAQMSMAQAWEEMGIQGLWALLAERFNLLSVISSVNVVSLLSLGILDLPSLVAAKHLDGTLPGEGGVMAEVSNGVVALGIFGLLVLAGLVVALFYQSMIAHQARDSHLDLNALAARLGRNLLHVGGVLLALLIAAVLIGGPVSLVLLLVGYFSPTLMQILIFVVGALALWVSLYLIFITHGIVLGEETPLKALWASMNIVHKEFWAVIIMLILIRVIRSGFLYVWPLFMGTSPGVAVAILGNAFLSAGLAAASFCFYRDSYRAWKEHLAHLALLHMDGPSVKGGS